MVTSCCCEVKEKVLSCIATLFIQNFVQLKVALADGFPSTVRTTRERRLANQDM